MRRFQSMSLSIAGVLLGLSWMSAAHATILIEGDQNPTLVKQSVQKVDQAIELIEGTQKVDNGPPPVPKLYGGIQINEPPAGNAFLAAHSFTVPPIGLESNSSLASAVSRYNKSLSPELISQISSGIDSWSRSYNLDPKLVASLVAVESSFRPTAISSSGAIGLGQLKPATARWLGVSDPYDPSQNLMGVAKYLRYLLDRYDGSVPHALAAYYQGQGTIDQRGIDDGARYYIGKVTKVYDRFSE